MPAFRHSMRLHNWRDRAVLTALLALTTVTARAEWVKVDESSDATIYIDYATIRKNGQFREVWVLIDRKKKNSNGERSYRTLSEYDCRERRRRTIDGSSYAGHMGTGKIIDAFVSGNERPSWLRMPPGAVGETVFDIVCAR